MRGLAGWVLCVALGLGALGTACGARRPFAVVVPEASLPEAQQELLGPLTREEIEAALPTWVEAEIQATPDDNAAMGLVEALEGAEVTVFLGTWCSDSRRELARLWRAFDDAALEHPSEIRYVGVDRSKKKPTALVAASGLLLVPTFIVRRDGQEVGRIVEESPGGIENDLLALLSGERRGLVTTKGKLLEEAMGGEY